MDQLGRAVGQGLGSLASGLGDVGGSVGRLLGDALGSVDVGIHQFFPWFIPTWLILGAFVGIVALFVFRR